MLALGTCTARRDARIPPSLRDTSTLSFTSSSGGVTRPLHSTCGGRQPRHRRVISDPTVVVRDIQDPAHARNGHDAGGLLLSSSADDRGLWDLRQPHRHRRRRRPHDGVATCRAGLCSGQYAFSQTTVSHYVDNSVASAGPSERVLATLPAAPGGISRTRTTAFSASRLTASPRTFQFSTRRNRGAPSRIRRASGGRWCRDLGMTMAVWASLPSRPLPVPGSVNLWDAAQRVLDGFGALDSPHQSPTVAGSSSRCALIGVGGVKATPGGRDDPPPAGPGLRVLTNDLVWYAGERASDASGAAHYRRRPSTASRAHPGSPRAWPRSAMSGRRVVAPALPIPLPGGGQSALPRVRSSPAPSRAAGASWVLSGVDLFRHSEVRPSADDRSQACGAPACSRGRAKATPKQPEAGASRGNSVPVVFGGVRRSGVMEPRVNGTAELLSSSR
jgi:hypothetical protein